MARTGVRAAAIIIRNNEILLMHRIKNGLEYWVFPGGGVEDYETSSEAIVREVKEETNLDVLKYQISFTDEKDGVKHPYYTCEVSNNAAEIVGEEKDRNSAENFYELEWIQLSKISSLNILPETAKIKFIESISKV